MLASKLAALVALAAFAGCAAAIGPNVVEIHSATIVEIPPGDGDAARTPPSAARFSAASRVPLPDLWSASRRGKVLDAWYRAAVDLREAPQSRWVVYLPRVSMNAEVRVNGESIGDGGAFAPAIARNQGRPLLFVVPPGLLRAGENVVEIRLAVDPTILGALGPILVGPESEIHGAYERQTLAQVTLVELSIVLLVCFGVAALRLSLRRNDLPGFSEAAVACLLWAVAMLELVVREPPLPASVWHWLGTSALAGTGASLVIGTHRYLELGRPWLERGVLAVWLAGAGAFGLALAHGNPTLVDGVVIVWAATTFGFGLYLIWLLFLMRRTSSSRSIRFAAPLGVIGFAAAGHDTALALGEPIAPSFLLFPLIGSAVAVWGGVRLLERFGQALSESEQLNRDLEQRVAERGREIERNYERIGGLEREQVVERERERLMGDIHDGLGSQLSSTLALVESESVPREEVADALRDALDDMRLLIASLAPGDDDVIGLLARWRGRIERRLERRELRFDWQVTELPPLPWLGPRESLNVLRIFQEAVSNVAQHANARTITVRTAMRAGAAEREGVTIEIRDDGSGPPGGWPADDERGEAGGFSADHASTSAGFGIGNMKRRAGELGGALAVADAHPGTSVVLWLPLSRNGGVVAEGSAADAAAHEG